MHCCFPMAGAKQLSDPAIPALTIIAQSERGGEGAQCPSIKSSSHKMVLTQAKKGDGSCGFVVPEKFVP